MIEELPAPRLAYRFTHELVRRALYDRLARLRRAELHLRVGEALEARRGARGRALADLAHHFAAAAPLGGAERGDRVQRARGARGQRLRSPSTSAATRLRIALELGIDDAGQRGRGLLELGAASHRAGKAVDALDAFTRRRRSPASWATRELLARAAIGYEEACWRPGHGRAGRGRAARGGGGGTRRGRL